MRSLFFATIAIALLSVSSISLAQAPDLLSFQGYVTDPGGNPINHPGISIRFKLIEGSSLVWRETQPSVEIVDGVFNVLLGSVIPLDTVAFNRPLLLRIKVGTDPEILPHTSLAAAAYAKALPGLYTYYRETGSTQSYNVVGGAANNVVGAGVIGATIGGGGGVYFGTLQSNRVDGYFGTIGGGGHNTADGPFDTIGGGRDNTTGGQFSTIGGGRGNTTADHGAVGGGTDNTASGNGATIPGGKGNRAAGIQSFAAGFNAKAIHNYSFVWNARTSVIDQDSLVSTGPSQFLIGASGGVGIGTNAPNAALHLVGRFQLGSIEYFEDGGGFELATNASLYPVGSRSLGTSTNKWSVVYATNGTIQTSDRRLKRNIQSLSGGLDTVMQLRPVSFNWIDGPDDRTRFGLVAQDLLDVIPDAVSQSEFQTDEETGVESEVPTEYMGINYSTLIPFLIKATQEQQAEIEQMRAAMERAGIE